MEMRIKGFSDIKRTLDWSLSMLVRIREESDKEGFDGGKTSPVLKIGMK